MHKTSLNFFNLVKDLEKHQARSIQTKELSEKTGLSRRTIMLLLGGSTNRIEFDTIDKLLDFFANEGMPVTVADLFTVERSD